MTKAKTADTSTRPTAPELISEAVDAVSPQKRRKVSADDRKTMNRVAITLPPEEFARLEGLKESLQKAGLYSVTRSQILRAGIALLAALQGPELERVVAAIERPRPGRK